jgi:hypothetical protein
VLPVSVSRLFLIISLLAAAALPAAAAAQTPTPEAPVATTGAADSITQTTANLNGTVDPNATTTTYHFEYGTSAGYGLTTPENTVPEGTDPVAVKAAIDGLTKGTMYHYRLVATNPAGISRGADRTFRTAPGDQAPAVKSTTYRDLTSRTVTLATQVDPNRQATTVRFEYGRSTSYGAFTDRVDAGSGDSYGPVSIPLAGLRPNTRYHFRAVATNATGSTRSADRTFVTRREPSSVSLSIVPSKVVWGGGLTLIGRVNGSGVGGVTVTVQRQDFPFQSAFSDVANAKTTSKGTFQVNVSSLFSTTHFRAVTQTRFPVASAIRTASSAVKVGIKARRKGRKKATISGTLWPALPNGRVSLQKRSPRGKWAVVKRQAAKPSGGADRSTYRFTVKKPKPKKPASRYRVVVLARDGGAHVPGRSRQVRVAAARHR